MPRPLKIFTVDSYVSHISPKIINDVLGAPWHISQGHVYVVARTKKDAARFLSDAGLGNWKTGVIHETNGNHLVAFTSATGFLGTNADTYEGNVAVACDVLGGDRFAVPGPGGWEVVGETTFKDPENPRRRLNRPWFVPVDRTPHKPIRLVIELDADTPAEAVQALLAHTMLRVSDVTNTTYAFGKVIES